MSSRRAHLYHCRFSPPLPTRRYPHMGEHICVGWLLVAERPLPEMAPFNLRRREADLRGVHSVTVHPLSAAAGELRHRVTARTSFSMQDALTPVRPSAYSSSSRRSHGFAPAERLSFGEVDVDADADAAERNRPSAAGGGGSGRVRRFSLGSSARRLFTLW